jgi:hypothetical protein
MGNRLRTRLFTGPVLVLGLLGTVLLWAAPGMASPSPQTDASDQSATSADQSTTTTTAPSDTASPITVHATCTREGRKLRINYTVRSWEPELTAPVVEVWFQVTGGRREPLPSGSFAPDQQEFSGHVLIDAPTEEGSTLEIIARAHWTDPTEKSLTKHSQPLPLPTCPAGVTTTSSTVAGATSTTSAVGGATSTTSAVGGATTTTAGGQLPFTGTSSGPTVLVGGVMVAFGALLVWASRGRRHAR